MTPKQFVSNGDIVLPALRGLVRTSPFLSLIESERVVFNSSSAPDGSNGNKKVTLISGGGSGHEPTHAGFVGEGMLDAAVAGTIFASPSTKQIYAGLKAVESTKGTLIVVKNYTGDIIHFGLAAERAKAQGIPIEVVIVGDDVAVGKAQGGLVGRRGLAGTVLVHKIAGAAAAKGFELSKVADIARAVIANSVTIGASLDHCNVPGRHFETNLKSEEYELGMGIHNEPGVKKSSPLPTIPELVSEMLTLLLSTTDSDRSFVPFGPSDEVILLVNNLGGISNLELTYATEVVYEELRNKYKIVPVRTVAGGFITALNGPGFSVTLVNTTRAGHNVIDLFDAPTQASGWNNSTSTAQWSSVKNGSIHTAPGPESVHKSQESSGVSTNATLFAELLKSGVEKVLKEEAKITEYDTIAGDGDCGETLANGGNAILKALNEKAIRLDDGVNAIVDIAEIVEDSMGGTSGGLYSIFLNALAQGVQKAGSSSLSTETFAKATKFALDNLFVYTKARLGDRTLIDTLAPFVDALSTTNSFGDAVKAAVDGANSTRKLDAKFGRASYVSKEELRKFDHEGGLPDPGAIGLAALLEGFLAAYQK